MSVVAERYVFVEVERTEQINAISMGWCCLYFYTDYMRCLCSGG